MPLHAMLVHFPIALLLASVVFDLVGHLRKEEKLHFAGYYTLIGGVAGAALAVVSGFIQAAESQARLQRLQQAMTAGGNGFLPGGGQAGGSPQGAAGTFFDPAQIAQQMMQLVSIHRLLALAALAVFLVLLIWRVGQKGTLAGRAGAYIAVALLGVAILVSAAFYGGELGHGRRGGPGGRDRGAGFRTNPPAGGAAFPANGAAPDGAAAGGGGER